MVKKKKRIRDPKSESKMIVNKSGSNDDLLRFSTNNVVHDSGNIGKEIQETQKKNGALIKSYLINIFTIHKLLKW